MKINKSNEFFKLLTICLSVLAIILFIVIVGIILKDKQVESSNIDINKEKIVENNKMVQNQEPSSVLSKNSQDENSSNLVQSDKMVENNNPIVVFETNLGNFEIELFVDKSPITAGNFKSLVEDGFYDGIKFHRVIKNFMIQGGDPLSKNDSLKNRWGTGGSAPIKDEFIRGLSNVRGTIAMANAGPNTGSSQFFINVVNNTPLDWDKAPMTSKHPVFGQVVSGMDVVDKIALTKVGAGDRPVDAVIIRKAYLK